jgi:tRNA G26 N,N-dimethylase Trm1
VERPEIYLHCPRCRLAIKCRADNLTLTDCPRCLARAAIAAPLFASPLNDADLHAADAEPRRAPRDSRTPTARRVAGADER